MVKMWAEKEIRNLHRMFLSRVPCPTPIFLRSHVLMMEFLGSDGWPAPKLKDAVLTQEQYEKGYIQVFTILFVYIEVVMRQFLS